MISLWIKSVNFDSSVLTRAERALLSIVEAQSLGLRPGAFGLPARGEVSFAVRTLWSSSAFGTFRMFRMMPLNFRNSGVFMNCSDVSGGRSSVSVSLTFMRHLHLSGELFV